MSSIKPVSSASTPYPPCEDIGKECRFLSGVSHVTSLHSPVEYNREGQPVGGGKNTSTKILHCTTCNSFWTSTASELEDVSGKPRSWKLKK